MSQPTPPPTAPLPPTPPPPPADTFDRIRAFGIARSSHGTWIGGVAAGLARRWNVDPILVRGLFVALTLVGGLGVLLYGLAWLLLPEEDGRIHAQQVTRGDVSAGFVGAVAFIVLFCLSAGDGGPGPFWWTGFPGIVVVGLVIAGVVWYQQDQRRRTAAGMPPRSATEPGAPPVPAGPAQARPYTAAPYSTVTYPPAYPPPGTPGGPVGPGMPPRFGPPQPPPVPTPPAKAKARASHRITLFSLGLAVLAAAGVVIAGAAQDADGWVVATLALAAALGVMALGVIVAGLLGRKSGGLAPLGILVAIALLATGGAASSDLDNGSHVTLFGDRTWRPVTVQQAERDWNLGAGDATLWLTDPALSTGRTATDPVNVRAQIGAGTLTLVVPADVPVEVYTELGDGEITRPDGSLIRIQGDEDANEHTVRTGPAGDPVMLVDVRMGFGTVEIRTGTPDAISPVPAPSVAPSAPAPGPAPSASTAPPAVTLTPTP